MTPVRTHTWSTITHIWSTITHTWSTITHTWSTITHTWITITHTWSTLHILRCNTKTMHTEVRYTTRVKLMWTCGLEYTHVSFVRAVSCKHSSSSCYKALQPSCQHYSFQTPLLQLIYKTLFVTDRYRYVFTCSPAMVLWRRLYCSLHDSNWTDCTSATALISIYIINVLVFCYNKLNLGPKFLLLRYRYHTANRTTPQGRSAYRMTGFAEVIGRLGLC